MPKTFFTILYIGSHKTPPKLIQLLKEAAPFSIKLECVTSCDGAIDFFNEVYSDYHNKAVCIFDLNKVDSESMVLEYINMEYPQTKNIILYKGRPWKNALALLNQQYIHGMIEQLDTKLISSVLSKILNEMFLLDQLELGNAELAIRLKEVEQKLSLRTTELTKKNIALHDLSVTDKLTQIPNRLKLDEQFTFNIQSCTRYQFSFSIILVDIDFFKKVNDTFGHQAGDDVLIAMANLLQSNLRNTDMVGRWGGEEFLILCPNSNLKQTVILANKLRVLIENHHFAVVDAITASFGVTEFCQKDTETEMLARADDALYEAKEKGRNIVIER